MNKATEHRLSAWPEWLHDLVRAAEAPGADLKSAIEHAREVIDAHDLSEQDYFEALGIVGALTDEEEEVQP